jgi:uncharacterized protein (UPF0248 family)
MGSKPDKKKKQDDVQSAVSNQTDNSVERRREEEQAKVTSEFAMAQIFEYEIKLHRLIQIVKQKIMKTNLEQVIYRE